MAQIKEHEIYTIGIVLLGNFNPSIITPFWLAHKNLIREVEATSAKIEVIHPNISRFSISDWLDIEATQERIDFKTNRESHFSVLRDLVVSIFSYLDETPIKSLGINHLKHYRMRDKKEYENLGYWLSPLHIFDQVLNQTKLQSIQFRETQDENKQGVITLTISPSDLIQDRKSVLFNANHHFNSKGDRSENIIKLLVNNWEYSFLTAKNVMNTLWTQANL
ncbi:MAG: hypothetical protein WBG71_06465 [Leeuwenhoekiella sp.]